VKEDTAPKRSDSPDAARRDDAELVQEVVGCLSLLASARRISLLEALRGGEASVQELADRLDLRHQKASEHLGLLRRAGVVSRRTEGAASFYSISDWTLIWVLDQVKRALSNGD
jgi:DNA-binding transcriptional ArsR family regulator